MNSTQATPAKSIRKEADGTWGRTVWFGSHNPTTIRRYYYCTRKAAERGDISDDIGDRTGRVA